MTTWLIHGFNVSDGGQKTIGRMAPFINKDENNKVRIVNYGWTLLFGLSFANRRATTELLNLVKPGDSVIAHSNGCLLAWNLADIMGDNLESVVCINPALRRDAMWPKKLYVLCIYNSTDWIVQLGRWWARLFPFDGIAAQGWGAAGRYGFTSYQRNVENWDSAESYWLFPVKGHSGVFQTEVVGYWSRLIARWLYNIKRI